MDIIFPPTDDTPMEDVLTYNEVIEQCLKGKDSGVPIITEDLIVIVPQKSEPFCYNINDLQEFISTSLKTNKSNIFLPTTDIILSKETIEMVLAWNNTSADMVTINVCNARHMAQTLKIINACNP